MRLGVGFKYHDDCIANHMKLMRSIRKSFNSLVGMATDELNLERNGEVNGTGLLCAGSVLKSGV